MGQEVHRKGLILRSTLEGSMVCAEITDDPFSMTMLEMHLQMDYEGARIVNRSLLGLNRDKIIGIQIEFGTQEDAVRFHLSH